MTSGWLRLPPACRAVAAVCIQATVYITAMQAFSGIAKDLMELAGKSTPELVTKDGAEGRLFRLIVWITGALAACAHTSF